MILNKLWKRKSGDRLSDACQILKLTRAIEKEPGEYSNYWKRAHAYDRQKKYMQAGADYERVLALNPGFQGALINRAACHTDLGAYEQAIRDLNALIAAQPRLAIAYHNRAINEFHLGMLAAAYADIDLALALDPKNSRYFLSRAQIRFETQAGPDRQTLEDLNQALHLGLPEELAQDARRLLDEG